MKDTTIIIVTFNRPELCKRAVDSALAQTYPCSVEVYNDGCLDLGWSYDDKYQRASFTESGRSDHWYASVYDAVYRAQTTYVTVLCDDDWLEPTFIEKCRKKMYDDVAYAFTESVIHLPSGQRRHWEGELGESRILTADFLAGHLMASPKIISPSFALYRRADLLRALCPGGVPGFRNAMENCHCASGPDLLMALLPLLDYKMVAWIEEPLANLDGGGQSTTMQAITGPDLGESLHRNYNDARALFIVLRELKSHLGR
jgi:hypothetical protein